MFVQSQESFFHQQARNDSFHVSCRAWS